MAPAYWSISPRLGEKNSRHGFSDDSAYFPDGVRAALGNWLVVPPSPDFETTARALLSTPDLRAVSVWSPTYLLKLDEALGTEKNWDQIWPELRVVSCWADAQAAMWKARVLDRLGAGVAFEPKGLLATEGVTSIPGPCGATLAEGVHFHEFLDRATGSVLTKPDPGTRYEVILTTAAGLYRYRTGDLIVSDHSGAITFLGRAGGVSDLCGEKLDEAQVTDAYRAAGATGFVRPVADALCYEFWCDRRAGLVLERLRENPHFARALESGQLAPCRVHELSANWQADAARFLAASRGGREGDVKLPVIERGELGGLFPSDRSNKGGHAGP